MTKAANTTEGEATMSQLLAAQPAVTITTELRERCDRCGAAAKVSVQLADGGELAFCGHHANSYSDHIVAIAGLVVIESGFSWRAIGPFTA
jgi:hypothetical protein